MNFAFFGHQIAFNYRHIGGTNSLVRRLVDQLVSRGEIVDYVTYGDSEQRTEEVKPGWRLFYNRDFSSAANILLREGYQHVVSIYTLKKDRFAYGLMRLKAGEVIKFHSLFLGWPENIVRRELSFLEAILFPYNGRLIGVSPRLENRLKQISPRAALLMPPVPASFFLTPEQKAHSTRLRVTWIGRLDSGKGIDDVLDVFERLGPQGQFELLMSGIYWQKNSDVQQILRRIDTIPNLTYLQNSFEGYTDEVEQKVGDLLAKTDVFLNPYQRLSSTIDMPLLMLEAMAALAIVISRPMGDIGTTYGTSRFLAANGGAEEIKRLVNESAACLQAERVRLAQQNQSLKFTSPQVAETFLDLMNEYR